MHIEFEQSRAAADDSNLRRNPSTNSDGYINLHYDDSDPNACNTGDVTVSINSPVSQLNNRRRSSSSSSSNSGNGVFVPTIALRITESPTDTADHSNLKEDASERSCSASNISGNNRRNSYTAAVSMEDITAGTMFGSSPAIDFPYPDFVDDAPQTDLDVNRENEVTCNTFETDKSFSKNSNTSSSSSSSDSELSVVSEDDENKDNVRSNNEPLGDRISGSYQVNRDDDVIIEENQREKGDGMEELPSGNGQVGLSGNVSVQLGSNNIVLGADATAYF